jgi:hypothetical protein
MKKLNYIKKNALKDYGEGLALSIYKGVDSEQGKFRKALKSKIKDSIENLSTVYRKKDSKLIVDGMYEEFGNMGEFLPQLYILNITKPRNIEKKKRDLWKSIEEIKE